MDSDVLSPTSKTKAGKMAIKTIVLAGMRLAAKTGGVQYFYHDEKCNNCGICAKVCLSGKVKMTPSEPAWKRDVGCLMCFACLNYCPRHAVQIKSIPGVKSFTQSNGRYPHPFATLADIMGQKSLEALP
jgi:ferredoxin